MTITIVTAIFMLSGSIHAQDYIIKMNRDDIKAKVLEITTTEIKYKRYDNPDGATYVIPKSEVMMIRHNDGTKDIFNSPTTEPVAPTVIPTVTAISAPAVSGNTLTLQNNTREDIDISYVLFDKDVNLWVSRGWFNIAPYSSYVVELGEYTGVAHVYGQHNKSRWGQGAKFCVEDDGMKFKILHADRHDCRKSRRFDEVKLTGKNTLWLFE